jgi:transposase
MARPTKWTPEREQAVLEALRAGMSRRGAAEYAGISVDTLERRVRRFAGFAATLRQAEASVELRAVRTITTAWGEGDWRAGLAWLERRRHDDWGKRQRIEILATILEMAASAGIDQAAAVAECERFLRELRGAGR